MADVGPPERLGGAPLPRRHWRRIGRSGAPCDTDGLLDRDAERPAIADVLVGATRGSGAVVLVEAPAGLGKSALLDDTVASADVPA